VLPDNVEGGAGVNLDIFSLKDAALEECANLPPTKIIAADRPKPAFTAVVGALK
jgi:hypothetical protein